jgi:RimJ/RimL family protein N-acetyltransferase
MIIDTPRTRLRSWRLADRRAFAVLSADPEVMRGLGGPMDRVSSDAKLDRYIGAFERAGYCRWAIETRDGRFLGYAGLMPLSGGHPLAPGVDIGWCLTRGAWGRGYATEAAGAAMRDGFSRLALDQIVAYTAPDNRRSRAVMERLGMRRDPARDFTTRHYGPGVWRGFVWVARADANRADTGPGVIE